MGAIIRTASRVGIEATMQISHQIYCTLQKQLNLNHCFITVRTFILQSAVFFENWMSVVLTLLMQVRV